MYALNHALIRISDSGQHWQTALITFFVFCFLIKRLLFRETADQNDDELDYCLLLQQIRDTIDDDHSIQFNINRLKILDGAVRAIKRKTFCDHPMGRLDIKFSDSFGSPESAIDAGGPTREFLRLLTSAVMRSPVFEGPANARILTRNETGELNKRIFNSSFV